MNVFSTLKQASRVLISDLWDRGFYCSSNPDVKDSCRFPLLHYVRHGGFEGRKPSVFFDSIFYIAANPDVARAGVNPLFHYLSKGRKEGRLPFHITGSKCCICGGENFIRGPKQRTGILGVMPQCASCNSLERHRALRAVWNEVPKNHLSKMRVIQFSGDRSVEPSWFQTYEVSEYEGENSLDLMNIQRSDGSYDLVVCNHVLEHVSDDKRAFSELMRITSDRGVVQVAFPDPLGLAKTNDWGYPDPDDHFHYRRYGADAPYRLGSTYPCLYVLSKDLVTGSADCFYLFSRSKKALQDLCIPSSITRWI